MKRSFGLFLSFQTSRPVDFVANKYNFCSQTAKSLTSAYPRGADVPKASGTGQRSLRKAWLVPGRVEFSKD